MRMNQRGKDGKHPEGVTKGYLSPCHPPNYRGEKMEKCFACGTKHDLIKIKIGSKDYHICDDDDCRDDLCIVLFDTMDEIRRNGREYVEVRTR